MTFICTVVFIVIVRECTPTMYLAVLGAVVEWQSVELSVEGNGVQSKKKTPAVTRRNFRSQGSEFKATSAVSMIPQLRLPHFAVVFRKRE